MDESGHGVSAVGASKAQRVSESGSGDFHRENRGAEWQGYVERCSRGDQAAFSALYDESSQLVYSLAVRLLTDTADAEEVTMDVYRQVWREAGQYNPQRGSIAAWLCILTRSRAIDRLRARRRHATQQAPAEGFELRDHRPSPEARAVQSQLGGRVQQALTALPAGQRQAVELAFLSGLSHAEIAIELGEPLGTIKTRIRLGMMKMRESLERVV